jgi:hypothetical protein
VRGLQRGRPAIETSRKRRSASPPFYARLPINQKRDRYPSTAWAMNIPALTKPKNAVTASNMAMILMPSDQT